MLSCCDRFSSRHLLLTHTLFDRGFTRRGPSVTMCCQCGNEREASHDGCRSRHHVRQLFTPVVSNV